MEFQHEHSISNIKLTRTEEYWDIQKWPNFNATEMTCNHCGEAYEWPQFMDCLQMARGFTGKPFHILSAHRCALHNARVGGAPLSQHLKLAVDISIQGHSPSILYQCCKRAGFSGFGFYSTFLHIDLGKQRHWYGNQRARQLWRTY